MLISRNQHRRIYWLDLETQRGEKITSVGAGARADKEEIPKKLLFVVTVAAGLLPGPSTSLAALSGLVSVELLPPAQTHVADTLSVVEDGFTPGSGDAQPTRPDVRAGASHHCVCIHSNVMIHPCQFEKNLQRAARDQF